ncbi:MAG: sugar-binding protein [Planctomycetota bacterium]
MIHKRVLGLLGIALGVSLLTLSADEPRSPIRALDKKLIEYGWDVPFPDFLRDHIREMERLPFDGIIFKLRSGCNVLTPKKFDPAKFAEEEAVLGQIAWGTFTDNFVILWAASDQDWFSDEHWEAIAHNARLLAHAARAARCVGVCFDQEPYGTNPWSYAKAKHKDTKSFAEYEAIVRRRGAQFMRAIESEFPGLTVLTFFQLSYFSDLLRPMDPARRAADLATKEYALMPAFLNGMLDAAGPGVAIIDGNEGAYYYSDSRAHFEVYHRIAQRGRLLVDPALWPKYHNQVQVGQALYIDQYFGLRTRKVLGHYMTPEERPKWFEHNVYWAMYTADKYVWCYSERMNWWTNKDVPPGCEDAIRAARAKLAEGKPLGFDLKPIVEKAQERQRAETASRMKTRSAEIARLPADAKPAIDGRLDDAAWQGVKPLESFVALASHPPDLKAQTQAWVAYDNAALYVAVRCQEPKPANMRPGGANHDDSGIWEGDDVELMIAAPGKTLPFYHFMVNPKGLAWDAVHTPEADLGYSPTWERAAAVGADAWTAEIAIPWTALNMPPPQPGAALRANLCRQRTQDGELSAWSPMADGFLEHEAFGTWTFR